MARNSVLINQWGFSPDEEKSFLIPVEKKDPKPFFIIATQEKNKVFSGMIGNFRHDELKGIDYGEGDFTRLNAPGLYTLQWGRGETHEFQIASSVYQDLFKLTMASYYFQRCACGITDKSFKLDYPACHLEDAYMKGREEISLNVTGGWHDAGDYGKYISPAALAIAQILLAYERHPDFINSQKVKNKNPFSHLPDVLGEVYYEIQWLKKMQHKSGGVYHKVNSIDFPGIILPHEDKLPRMVYQIGTLDTAHFCGAMAMAARLWKTIDAKEAELLGDLACKSGAFLRAQNKLWLPENDETGMYTTRFWAEACFWAFAELYRLSGEPKDLEWALKYYRDSGMPPIGWGNTQTLGIYALLHSKGISKDLRDSLLQTLGKAFLQLLNLEKKNTFANPLRYSDYFWASNKTLLAHGVACVLFNEYFPDLNLMSLARKQLHYILGRNPQGISYVTVTGKFSVRYPHHRVMMARKITLPGFLVGGPNNHAQDGYYKKNQGPFGYIDKPEAFSCNETAIDYNAPLVFLAAELACE